MPPFGMPELTIVLIVVVWSIVPIVAAIWALVTLYRIRTTQDAMRAMLERLEQAITRQ